MYLRKVRLLILNVLKIWKTIAIVLCPLVLAPIPLIAGNNESKVGYVALIMAVFWCLELLPLAVTSLLPVVMFPLMGIMTTKDVVKNYMTDESMNFVGSKNLIE